MERSWNEAVRINMKLTVVFLLPLSISLMVDLCMVA